MNALNTLLETTQPGGLGDIRALFAAIVGPYRLASGFKKNVRLTTQNAVLLYSNQGSGNAYAFIGVSLTREPTVPTVMMVGGNDQLGANSSSPKRLEFDMSASEGFAQLLLPGEQLFAQLDNALPDNTIIPVVVSVVNL